MVGNLCYHELSKDVLGVIPKACFKEEKKKINWTIKIENFCSSKVADKRMKRQARTGRNLQIMYLTKDLYPEYIRNSRNSVRK